MLSGVIYMLGFSAFSIIVAAFSATYLMPLLGTLFKGPERVLSFTISLFRVWNVPPAQSVAGTTLLTGLSLKPPPQITPLSHTLVDV